MPHHINLAVQVLVTISGIFASTVLADSLVRAVKVRGYLRKIRYRAILPYLEEGGGVAQARSVGPKTIICPAPPASMDNGARRKAG